MAEYYAITRSDDFLEHYGIKGMKWGVRKAIQSGNTRALGRQYRKAQRKLARLEKRANSGAKYARRAAALGAGAAAAGGLAALGTSRTGALITKGGYAARKGLVNAGTAINRASGALGRYGNKTGNKVLRRAGMIGVNAGNAMSRAGKAIGSKGLVAGEGLRKWGQANTVAKRAGEAYGGVIGRNYATLNKAGVYDRLAKSSRSLNDVARKTSNNTVARIGAGAAAAGLAGAAGYNAYRAATTKRAARKAAEFRSEMNKAFAGTQYANGGRGGNRRRRRR